MQQSRILRIQHLKSGKGNRWEKGLCNIRRAGSPVGGNQVEASIEIDIHKTSRHLFFCADM